MSDIATADIDLLVEETIPLVAREHRRVAIVRGFSAASRSTAAEVRRKLDHAGVVAPVIPLALMHRVVTERVSGRLLLVDASDSGPVRAAELAVLMRAELVTFTDPARLDRDTAILVGRSTGTVSRLRRSPIVVQDLSRGPLCIHNDSGRRLSLDATASEQEVRVTLAPGSSIDVNLLGHEMVLSRADGSTENSHVVREVEVPLEATIRIGTGSIDVTTPTRLLRSDLDA